MVIGEIESLLSIFDRVINFLRNKKNGGVEKADSVATRFVRVFESHGVHRNQIPRFFGYGLALSDVQSDETLLSKLTDEMLDVVCEMFAVRREWMDGSEEVAHPTHDFYKQPAEFEKFLGDLLQRQNEGRIRGVVLAPNKREIDTNALIIIEEAIGRIGDKQVSRFHLCGGWLFSYWKVRGYLAACVALAWKHKVYVHGVRASKKIIEKLEHGEALLGWEGEGIHEVRGERWDPEDMASLPKVYLDGLDRERDDFGIKSALNLWLRLESEGFMDAGYGSDSRQSFEKELAKY